jgi:hypothetical protein
MERSMRIILLSALLTASVFAQHRGGAAPAGHSYSAPPTAARYVGSRPVGGPSPVARPPYAPRPYQPRTVIVPYPVFVGGGGYYSAPANAYVEQQPIAYVNQDFRPDAVNPSLVDYSNVPLPEPNENSLADDQPTIFLIALTDHTVVAAIAYWVDGDTLNWISRDAKQNRMSLSLVDRDFSKQINDERHVEFKLPPAKE